MPKFDEFINDFRYDPDTFNADQFKAAAQAAYQEDITGVNSVVAEKDQAITELTEKAKTLGADNWRLSMKLGPAVPEGQTPQTSSSDGTGEAAARSIESFFKKRE